MIPRYPQFDIYGICKQACQEVYNAMAEAAKKHFVPDFGDIWSGIDEELNSAEFDMGRISDIPPQAANEIDKIAIGRLSSSEESLSEGEEILARGSFEAELPAKISRVERRTVEKAISDKSLRELQKQIDRFRSGTTNHSEIDIFLDQLESSLNVRNELLQELNKREDYLDEVNQVLAQRKAQIHTIKQQVDVLLHRLHSHEGTTQDPAVREAITILKDVQKQVAEITNALADFTPNSSTKKMALEQRTVHLHKEALNDVVQQARDFLELIADEPGTESIRSELLHTLDSIGESTQFKDVSAMLDRALDAFEALKEKEEIKAKFQERKAAMTEKITMYAPNQRPKPQKKTVPKHDESTGSSPKAAEMRKTPSTTAKLVQTSNAFIARQFVAFLKDKEKTISAESFAEFRQKHPEVPANFLDKYRAAIEKEFHKK